MVVAILTLLAWVGVTTPAQATPSGSMPFAPGFKQGIYAYEQGNYPAAIDAFTQTLEQVPTFAPAYTNRCLAHLQIGNYVQAIGDCDRGIELAPNNPEPYLNRGLAQYRLGKFMAAIASYDDALRLRPDEVRGYYNRALARVALQHYDAALADFNQTLDRSAQVSPLELADIYDDRGLVYLLVNQPDQAADDFTQALQLNHQDIRAYFNLGCCCQRQGEYGAAIANFDQVIHLNHRHAQAYFNRGLLKQLQGNQAGAIADLTQAAAHFRDQGATAAYRQVNALLLELQNPPSVVG